MSNPTYSWQDIRAGHPHPLTSFMLLDLQQDTTELGIEVSDAFAKQVGPAIRPSMHPSLVR